MRAKKNKNKVSIYMIKKEYCKNLSYLKDPAVYNNKVYEDIGILYYDTSIVTQPKWVKSFFKESFEELKQANSRAVLVIKTKDNERLFAITFGLGKHMIKDEAINHDFGIKVLLNSINDNEIKVLSKQSLVGNHNISQEQLPKATNITDFNFDTEQDLAKKFVGKPSDGIFKNCTITGGEVLSLSNEYNIDNIKDLVEKAYATYSLDNYKKNFLWIDNVHLIKKKEERKELDKLLDEKIRNEEVELRLMLPEVINWEALECFRYINTNSPKYDYLDIDNYLETIGIKQKELTVEIMNRNKVLLYATWSDSTPFNRWTIYKCLIVEINEQDSIYCLVNGDWYKVNNNFYKTINDFYKNIHISDIDFIDFQYDKEDDYNDALANHLNNASLLHKATIKTEETVYGVEVADVYWNNKFIHIKNGTKSSSLSHLFNQGYVSGNLLMQANFREKCIEIFSKEFSNPNLLANLTEFQAENNEIVLAIISKQVDDRPKIPFFSKITLKNIVTVLKNYGYNVTIKNIKKL